MNTFLSWRNWAGSLDDDMFSRLWLALGAVMALRPRNGMLLDRIDEVWDEALRTQELRWTMPRFEDLLATKLQGSTPEEWVTRWNTEISSRLAKVPIRVNAWPESETSTDWHATLYRQSPIVSLRLPSDTHKMLGWPLRLAALHDADLKMLEHAITGPPVERLARMVGSSGLCYSCDVLLVSGELDAQIATLGNGDVSARILVLRQTEPFAVEDMSRLLALVEATQAGGFICVDESSIFDLPGRFRQFVEEISHARRIDVAACLAFGSSAQPALVGIGDTLSRFTIRAVAARLIARSKRVDDSTALPPAVRSELANVMPRVPLAHGVPEPQGAEPEYVEHESSGLESAGSETGASRGGLESLGGQSGGAAASEPASAASGLPEPTIPDFDQADMPYGSESGGATVLAEAAEVLDRAEAAVGIERYLQQEAFIVRDGEPTPATNGFLVGAKARVIVHIGPPDRDVNRLPEAFPEDALPQEFASWELDVWLSEPTHLRNPMHGQIELHRSGPSSSCSFEFTPKVAGAFNGRISVLHRGRVIQTAALRSTAMAPGGSFENAVVPVLESVIQIKPDLSDLDRRRFGAAVVLNHAAVDQPIAHIMGEAVAWLWDLQGIKASLTRINNLLSNLARSAVDFAGGLDSDDGKTLLRDLAIIGSGLYFILIEAPAGEADSAEREKLLAEKFLQVVSVQANPIVVPFEFVYSLPTPSAQATLCGSWREGIKAGACPGTCQHGAANFCPMGFWGLSKVIERHALQGASKPAAGAGDQDPGTARDNRLRITGSAVYACSIRVTDAQLAPLRQRMADAHLTGTQAKNWTDWATLVGTSSPSLLIALAHSDTVATGTTVEIGGEPIAPTGISKVHIRSPTGTTKPLVALLGCDMAGTDGSALNPVAVFSARGAAAVVGTVATVLAEHSANVAARLMQGLTFADASATRQLGEVMLDLKRDALLDGELMPLCLVSFGDADRKLSN